MLFAEQPLKFKTIVLHAALMLVVELSISPASHNFDSASHLTALCLQQNGNRNVLICERGTMVSARLFAYQALVVPWCFVLRPIHVARSFAPNERSAMA